MSRWRRALPCILVTLMIAAIFGPAARAYESGARWMTDDYGSYLDHVDYRIDPDLDSKLSKWDQPPGTSVQGVADQIRLAVNRANQDSRFTLVESTTPFDPNYRNIVSAAELESDPKCGGRATDYAIQCPDEDFNGTGRNSVARFTSMAGGTCG
jgi:hypothetical protein